MDKMYTVKEVCALLSITRRTLNKYEERKEIKHTAIISGRKIYTYNDIEKYFEQYPDAIWQVVKKQMDKEANAN